MPARVTGAPPYRTRPGWLNRKDTWPRLMRHAFLAWRYLEAAELRAVNPAATPRRVALLAMTGLSPLFHASGPTGCCEIVIGELALKPDTRRSIKIRIGDDRDDDEEGGCPSPIGRCWLARRHAGPADADGRAVPRTKPASAAAAMPADLPQIFEAVPEEPAFEPPVPAIDETDLPRGAVSREATSPSPLVEAAALSEGRPSSEPLSSEPASAHPTPLADERHGHGEASRVSHDAAPAVAPAIPDPEVTADPGSAQIIDPTSEAVPALRVVAAAAAEAATASAPTADTDAGDSVTHPAAAETDADPLPDGAAAGIAAVATRSGADQASDSTAAHHDGVGGMGIGAGVDVPSAGAARGDPVGAADIQVNPFAALPDPPAAAEAAGGPSGVSDDELDVLPALPKRGDARASLEGGLLASGLSGAPPLMTATGLPPPSGRKQSIARDLQSEVDFLMGENARMRVRITHLESEASFSKIALDKSTLDVEKLRHHLQLLNKDKSSLGKDLEVARETLHMVNSCLKEAEKRIKSFSQTLTKTMAPWEQKVKILEDENVELKREVKALRLYARMPAGLPASAAPSQPPVPRHASRSRSPSPSHSPAHTQHPSPMLGQTVTLPSI